MTFSHTPDFDLCTDLGCADFVNEWVAKWQPELIEMTYKELNRFIEHGIMSIVPPVMGLLVEIYDFDTSKPDHLRFVKIARDTLGELINLT